jgi:uncharacterized protein (DUF885 family)
MNTRYDSLLALFNEWRAFERPALVHGAPDYTAATLARKHQQLAAFQTRLADIDSSGWPVEQQVDYHIVRAELNGFDFNCRVLKPWERDPAFYQTVWTAQSDTPSRDGPVNHVPVELWMYSFPLTADAQTKLAVELNTIPPFLAQARDNLTGNARDLWIAGIGTIKQQAVDLAALETKVASGSALIEQAVRSAHRATLEFVAWLEKEAPSKTGPSGIGKDNYTWNLRNVHLVPMSWDEEVDLLKRELARAHSSLRLEEHRNRKLPELKAVANEAEYEQRTNEAVAKLVAFLRDQNILPMQRYTDSALRPHMGSFTPEDQRHFFSVLLHLAPLTLYTHFYHWWDLAQMREQPHASAIRRGPLLFNIWDSRAEGMATGFEEMMLHAGLFDDNPRAREMIWIMLAQRAARGLGSLYAHANEFTMKQAADFHVKHTPRGWMRPDLDLLGFEQQLYLRQPGYGTSYVTGKFLLEQIMATRAEQLGKDFSLSQYFSEVNDAGLIPLSLVRWQLTGDDAELKPLLRAS